MSVGERIVTRLTVVGFSQAELARRVGMSQGAMNSLIRGRSRSSTHLHKIAYHLRTTPSYLTGDIDDPDEGAPSPIPAPRTQLVMMPVGMPSEEALADMYEGQLRVFAKLSGAELARALAKRLPRALARLQAAELFPDLDDQPDAPEDGSLQSIDRPATQRSQRR